MRIVLDTNVLLAGVATHGICEGLLTIALRDRQAILSERILRELTERYVGKFKASAEQADVVASMLRRQCEVVTPAVVPSDAFEDADDLPVLGTVAAGRVDCLVIGDKRLLVLGTYQGIPLLSPRQFYDRLQAGG